MRKWLLPALQAAITASLLTWIFSDAELRARAAEAVRRARPGWLAAGVLFAGLSELTGLYRWRIFLRVQGVRVGWRRTGLLVMIGLFFNLFLLGAVGGDAVKIACLIKERPARRTAVVLSVLADRMSGVLCLMGTTAALVLGRHAWFTQSPVAAGMLFFMLGYVVLAALGVAALCALTGLGIPEKLQPGFPGREKLLECAQACRLFARAWRQTLWAAAVSAPVMFSYFAVFYCTGRAFGAGVSLLDMFSVMPIVDVITALPVAVSGVGVREKIFEQLLGPLCGVPAGVAVMISLAGFVCSVFWGVAGGLVFPFYRPSPAAAAPGEGITQADGVTPDGRVTPDHGTTSAGGTTPADARPAEERAWAGAALITPSRQDLKETGVY